MDSQQIGLLLKTTPRMRRSVWGVFSRNRLPQRLLPGGYVVNTDDRDGPGIHWIALWVMPERIEFMDSFGHVSEYYGWTFGLPTLYNTQQLQSHDSDVCGAYCLYFLYHRCHGRSMDSIIHDFSSDSMSNDSLVWNFLHGM